MLNLGTKITRSNLATVIYLALLVHTVVMRVPRVRKLPSEGVLHTDTDSMLPFFAGVANIAVACLGWHQVVGRSPRISLLHSCLHAASLGK